MSGITVTPGSQSDPIVATDTVAGTEYQVIKPAFGVAGTATQVSSSDPLPTIDAGSQAVLQAVNNLNDTMLYMMTAMLDKMPRLSREDRLVVELGESGLTSQYTQQIVNAVTNRYTGYVYDRLFEPWNFADMGSTRIYQQIIVS